MPKIIITKISRIFGYISLTAAFVLMAITVIDVFGRFFFDRPLRGVEDFSSILMVCIVFLGIALTQLEKGHVTVELVTSRLSKHHQALLDIISYLIGAAFFIVMSWQLGSRSWLFLLNPSRGLTGTSYWPLWPFILVASIGCLLLTLVLLIQVFELIKYLIKRDIGQEYPETRTS